MSGPRAWNFLRGTVFMSIAETTAGNIGSRNENSYLKTLLVAFLIYCAWNAGNLTTGLNEGALYDSDDFMRLHQIRNWMAGLNGWFDLSVSRMNPPVGADMHWSRIVDVPYAVLIHLFSIFTTAAQAEQLAMIVWPMVLFLVTILVVVRTGESLVPGASRLLLLVLAAGCVDALNEFRIFRIDHHNVQILNFALITLGLANAGKWWGHLLIGAAIAFSISIGLDVILLAVFVLAWLGLAWALGMDDGGAGLKRTALGLVAATLPLFLLNVAPANWLVAQCDRISIFYVLALMLVAAAFVTLAMASGLLTSKSRSTTFLARAAFGGLLAAAAAAVLLTAYPQCAAGPMSGISPDLKTEWLDKVMEAKGFLEISRLHPSLWFSAFGYLVVLIAACLAVIWHRGSGNHQLYAMLAMVVICFLGMFFQYRMLKVGILATVPVAMLIVRTVWDEAEARLGNRKIALGAVKFVSVFGLVSAVWLVAGALLTSPPSQTGAGQATNSGTGEKPAWLTSKMKPICARQDDYSLLASLPAGLVLNSTNEGPAILDFTHHFALAGNYHRNGDAILKTMRFFGGAEDEARRIADEVKPQYVAFCQRDPALDPLKPESDEMKQRILRGDFPSWLEPLSGPDDRLIVMRFRG
jgi:hypothetical protein